MPGPAPTTGPTLSPAPPTFLAAPAQAPGPLAPSPGRPTRPVTPWVLGSPLGPSPHPRPGSCSAPGPSWSTAPGGAWEGRGAGASCGISGELRERNQIPTSSSFGFFGPNPRETDKPSLLAGSAWREESAMSTWWPSPVPPELARSLPLPWTPQQCPPRGRCQAPLATLPQVS